MILIVPQARSAVGSFLLALLLASGVQSPIARLRRRHIPGWATALSILALLLIPLFVLTGWGCYSLIKGAHHFLALLEEQISSGGVLEDWFYRLTTALPPSLESLLSDSLSAINAAQLLGDALGKAGQWSANYLIQLPKKIASVAIFLLYFLFCAISYQEVTALFCLVLPAQWAEKIADMKQTLFRQFTLWGKAQLRLMAVIFSELALGLCLLRQEQWFFTALLITFVDLIPMVGSGLLLVPWAAMCALTGSKGLALGLLLLWLCVWGTRTILEPRLVGKHLQLPSALSFLAAVLGARIWGLKGLILFPVFLSAAVCCIKCNKGTA